MNAQVGDRIIIKDKSLRGIVDQIGLDPRKIHIRLDSGQSEWFWISETCVIPPKYDLFDYLESVIIAKPYDRRLLPPYHFCVPQLIGCVGKIVSYDSRDAFYLVETSGHGSGWFPATSLLPINYQGETFYYPNEEVKFKGRKVRISSVRRTKSNRGQIVLIDGEWIPSSHILPLRR